MLASFCSNFTRFKCHLLRYQEIPGILCYIKPVSSSPACGPANVNIGGRWPVHCTVFLRVSDFLACQIMGNVEIPSVDIECGREVDESVCTSKSAG